MSFVPNVPHGPSIDERNAKLTFPLTVAGLLSETFVWRTYDKNVLHLAACFERSHPCCGWGRLLLPAFELLSARWCDRAAKVVPRG